MWAVCLEFPKLLFNGPTCKHHMKLYNKNTGLFLLVVFVAGSMVGCGSATPLVKESSTSTATSSDVVDISSGFDVAGSVADTGSETHDVTQGGDGDFADGVADTSEVIRSTCFGPELESPEWYHGAVGYEVFVRSYQDSDGDGIGDLQGLRSRLDYLNDGNDTTDSDLGVDLLWLMPVFESPSYHGYDVVDYRTIENDYGTNADLKQLVEDAHARGIKVIVDLVINHSSSQHPWFVDAATGQNSAFRDYYVWSDSFLDWQKPWGPGTTWHKKGNAWYYGLFSSAMPDLNLTTDAVVAEIKSIADHWLMLGVDGFRLDAARYLIETGGGVGQADTEQTHQFWQEFRNSVAKTSPQALLVGEVWDKTSVVIPYFGDTLLPELNMLFDFDAASGLLQTVSTGKGLYFKAALCERLMSAPGWAAVGSFLTNHDMTRVATELSHKNTAGMKLAAALMLTSPGTPWLYYGEEIGLPNGKGSGDETKRLPMQWDAGHAAGFTTGTPWQSPVSDVLADTVLGQTDSPTSLLSWYKTLIKLRKSSKALRFGSTEIPDGVGSGTQPLVMIRRVPNETILVVANPTDETQSFVWTVPNSAGAQSRIDKITGERVAIEGGRVEITGLEPLGFRVFQIQ